MLNYVIIINFLLVFTSLQSLETKTNIHTYIRLALKLSNFFLKLKNLWIRLFLLFFNLFSLPTHLNSLFNSYFDKTQAPEKFSTKSCWKSLSFASLNLMFIALKVFWVNSVTITVLFKAYIQAEGCKVYHFQWMRFIVTGRGRNNGTKYSTCPRYWCSDCLGTTTSIRKTMIQLNHLHTALHVDTVWHTWRKPYILLRVFLEGREMKFLSNFSFELTPLQSLEVGTNIQMDCKIIKRFL